MLDIDEVTTRDNVVDKAALIKYIQYIIEIDDIYNDDWSGSGELFKLLKKKLETGVFDLFDIVVEAPDYLPFPGE